MGGGLSDELWVLSLDMRVNVGWGCVAVIFVLRGLPQPRSPANQQAVFSLWGRVDFFDGDYYGLGFVGCEILIPARPLTSSPFTHMGKGCLPRLILCRFGCWFCVFYNCHLGEGVVGTRAWYLYQRHPFPFICL